MKSQAIHSYIFGVFRVDTKECVLYGEKGVVPLAPKVFETLLVLVENSGHVLTKEELMEKVWPDSFVEENNLAQNISALRKALSEESGGDRFIETVPKRGYRFAADVRQAFGTAEGRPETETSNKMQADNNEGQHKKEELFLRDVVLIGRAIDFK